MPSARTWSRACKNRPRAHWWNTRQDGKPRILNNAACCFFFFFRWRHETQHVSCAPYISRRAYISRPTHKFIARLISANKTARARQQPRACLRTSAFPDQFPDITGIFHRTRPIPLAPRHSEVSRRSHHLRYVTRPISLGTR